MIGDPDVLEGREEPPSTKEGGCLGEKTVDAELAIHRFHQRLNCLNVV